MSETTDAGREYRFVWSCGGNGLDVENSSVQLPLALTATIVGDKPIMLGESVSIQWPVDPDAEAMTIGTVIRECGIIFDGDGNIFYPELTAESFNAGYIRSIGISHKRVTDSGQITIASDPVIQGVPGGWAEGI